MDVLELDLHNIFDDGDKVERELEDVIYEALDREIRLVEIITGKGSGQLKLHVLRFLKREEIRKLYHRLEKDSKNSGRIFLHFKY